MSEELTNEELIAKGICPDCKGSIIFESGCKYCRQCGWEACG